MTVQLPTPGEDPWGDELNAAITALDGRITALEGGAPPEPSGGAIHLNPAAFIVQEGATATYTVVLTAVPTATVTIAVASPDTSKATAVPASLTFTTTNWDVPQTVTVTGVVDADFNDINVLVSNTATGGQYDGQSKNATVTVNDTSVVTDNYVPLVLFIGESNSGGVGLNSDLAASELLPRPRVQIWDNINNDGFDTLQIGVNNLLGHSGLEAYATDHHGWEAGLALSVEADDWRGQDMHLVKAGQGASTINQWTTGGDYWNKFVQRIDGAKAAITATGKTPQVYVWASLGVNDHIAGTPVETFRVGLLDWILRIRQHLGRQAPFMFTEFPASRQTYNDVLYVIDANDGMFFLHPTGDCPLQPDGNHWTAAGMKKIATRFENGSLVSIGQGAAYESKVGLPSAPTPSDPTDPVLWTSLVAATASPDGSIHNTGGPPSGGVSPPLSGSEFSVVTELVNAAQTEAAVVCLSANNAALYDWPNQTQANGMLGGLYHVGVDWYWADAYDGANTKLSTVTSYPCRVRYRNVGNDIQADVSYNAGTTWTAIHTGVGRLTGHATVWLKEMIAGGSNMTMKSWSATGVVPDLPPPDPTMTPVVWTSLQNGTTDGNGTFTDTGTHPAGALGGTVDAHNFTLIMDWASLYSMNACIVLLDDENTPNYVWDTNQTYIAGMHSYNTLQASTGYTSSVDTGHTLVPGELTRMRSDGANDIVVESKAGTEVGFTVRYRWANAALGKTTLYIKTVHAADGIITKASQGLGWHP